MDIVSSRVRRRDARFSWSVHTCRRLQCRIVAWHCAWCQGMVAASPVSPPSLLQFFLHVVQSALGGPLVNSLLSFYGLLHRHRSKRVRRRKNLFFGCNTSMSLTVYENSSNPPTATSKSFNTSGPETTRTAASRRMPQKLVSGELGRARVLELAQRIPSPFHRDSACAILRHVRLVATRDSPPSRETDDWVVR